jgi:stage V sporulation protein SpoVS
MEAGRVASREQLFRVSAVAVATHLRRHREIEIKPAVGGGDVAVTAISSRRGFGRVQNLVGHRRTLSITVR